MSCGKLGKKNKSSSIDTFYCSPLPGGLKQAAFHSNVALIIAEIKPVKRKWIIEWVHSGKLSEISDC